MGNITSNEVIERRRNGTRQTVGMPRHPQPGLDPNPYVFAGGTPYPLQHHQAAPYDQQGGPHASPANRAGYPYWSMMPPPVPFVEHQKAVVVKNNVNLKKETLKLAADEENPGKFLVTFKFDATTAGRIAVVFFAKEGEGCNLIPTKGNILPPVTCPFEQGIGQEFRQSSGTGISSFLLKDSELQKVKEDIYPLVVKLEAADGNQQVWGAQNSQITLVVLEKEKEKEKGEYRASVAKQILWANGVRYELQEIYGIGNSVDDVAGASGAAKDVCLICLTEPRDTTVLPCRHMCMCSSCAKVLRHQTNRCPVCRQPVERLLEIKVNHDDDE